MRIRRIISAESIFPKDYSFTGQEDRYELLGGVLFRAQSNPL
jgi:hypothetical protein